MEGRKEVVTIKTDRETAAALMRAAEFYSRVLCGQFEEISEEVNNNRMRKISDEEGSVALHEKFDREIRKRVH